MKLFLLICFAFSATDICSGCNVSMWKFPRASFSNAIPAGEYVSDLRFSAGDIISCEYRSLVAASHIMLPVSSASVIHAQGPSSDGPQDRTRVLEKDFDDVSRGFSQCKVITAFYDQKYASSCGGTPFSTDEILRRADASWVLFRGRVTHYDTFKCNSEHWVSAWRYGTSWTLHAGATVFRSKYRSDQCEAPGKQECF